MAPAPGVAAPAFLVTVPQGGTSVQGLGLLMAVGYSRAAVTTRSVERPSLYLSPLSLLSHALGDPLRLACKEAIVEEVRAAAWARGCGEPPLLVVGCGHAAMSTLREIKRACNDGVFAVAIQHPHGALSKYDLVITPAHDWIHNPCVPRNVLLTQGSLHCVNAAALAEVRASAEGREVAALPQPCLGVLVGGPTGNCRWDCPSMIAFLISLADGCLQRGWRTLLVSASRRTPPQVAEFLSEQLPHRGRHVVVWKGSSAAVYACAGALVVTSDSHTMVSEACATRLHVYAAGVEACRGKLVAFHHYLAARGLAGRLPLGAEAAEQLAYADMLVPQRPTAPLDDTAMAAAEVLRRWQSPAMAL